MHMTKLTDTDLCNNLIICNVTENINNSFFFTQDTKNRGTTYLYLDYVKPYISVMLI